MKRCPRPWLAAAGVILLLGAGCSSPAGPEAAPAAGREAAEQARREERLKIMQQYWYEQTATAAEAPAAASGGEPRPLLSYPAGLYAGLRFGPRRALDPSLAEPDR
jgi:hypothetical protein